MLYLISVVAFLGLLLGFCLHKYIPEEEEQMKKPLFYAQKILLVLLIFVLFWKSFTFSLPVVFFLASGIVAGFLFHEEYMYFGFALLSFDFLLAVLVFLYGLTEWRNIFVKCVFFLPFLFLLLSLDTALFEMFAAGALFVLVCKR